MSSLLDSHLHLWNPDLQDYPWLDAEPALRRPFLPGDLDAGGHAPAGVIVVEAGCLQPTAELAWIEKLALDWPIIRGIVANVALERGSARATLVGLADRPLVAGVRRNAQDERPGFLIEPDFVAGVAALAAYDLTFDACVREHQLRELTQLVDRCPDVTFILDHLGKPDIRQRRRQPWYDDLADLARRNNVYAKLSGLTTEADMQCWQAADIRPYVVHALEVFEPPRCMFGSDWPVATLATRYERWADVVLDAIADLPDGARTAVCTTTATRAYGLADRSS